MKGIPLSYTYVLNNQGYYIHSNQEAGAEEGLPAAEA